MAKENVHLAPPQPLPRQASSRRPPSPAPLRPKMANGATEPPPVNGVLKCSCFRLPSRTSKKSLPPAPPPKAKLSSASRRSAVVPDVSGVTFRASSASLSTRWPSSPSAAPAGAAAGATAIPAPAAGSGGGSGVVAPRRASTSAAVAPTLTKAGAAASTSSSSSFSHWRCRSLSSFPAMPHGERVSFSFAVSPASASSSCMSTPKIPQGWQQK